MDNVISIPKRFDLTGRVALVTGSSRGIGRSIALGMAECGANVEIHYVKNIEHARTVALEAEDFGVQTKIIQADLSDDQGPKDLYEKAVIHFGQIDILVLNVSAQIRKPWHAISKSDFDYQVSLNLRSSMELMQYALPGMIERQWGRILTIGSVQQVKPHPEMLVYAATKSALLNMVQNLALQVAKTGVTINNLSPGAIETDRNRHVLEDLAYRQKVESRIPIGKIGNVEDCVGAAIVLCSEAGRYITGTNLFIDGGRHL